MRAQKASSGALVATIGVIAVQFAIGAALADDFYKGKQIAFVIPSGAGGGYDTYGRTLTRHMGKYIPGNPTFVVQNVPGASGLKGTNYIYSQAARDGSVIGNTYNSMTLEPLIGGHGASFDALKLNWLGSMGKQPVTCFVWNTSKTRTIEDAQRRVTTVGATGATGNRSTQPRLFNAVLGTKFKVINGYTTSDNWLAVERGEVEGICGTSHGTVEAVEPNWLAQKKIRFILQFSKEPNPYLAGVPRLTELVKDPKMKKVLDLFIVMQEIGQPVIAPPDVPADRLKILRTAFWATLKDPAFVVEAKKLKLEIDPIDSAEIESLLKGAYSAPKDVVAIAAGILARPKKGAE